MSQTEAASYETFLAETKIAGQGGKCAIASMGSLWDYLTKTPGEQRPYTEFARILDVNVDRPMSAKARLDSLVRRGLLSKTSSRRGTGGGVGFVCVWLEKRRLAGQPGQPEKIARNAVGESVRRGSHKDETIEGLKTELAAIEEAAERVVGTVRPLVLDDSRLGFAVVEAMREIQARVNRTRVGLTDRS